MKRMSAFEIWVRWGRIVNEPEEIETKFNPWHDPNDGRFTFAGQGSYFGGEGAGDNESGTGVASTAGQSARSLQPSSPRGVTKPQSVRPAKASDGRASLEKLKAARRQEAKHLRVNYGDLGDLSAKFESGGRAGVGTVSSGKNDPGGISYGSHQLSSKAGSVQRFLATKGELWAKQFAGLDPTKPGAFGAKWKEIAARDPAAFELAQLDYIGGNQYRRAVTTVYENTGLNLNDRGFAVREATWSSAVQHGHAPEILADAIASTDAKVARDDTGYDEQLIRNLYAARITHIYKLIYQTRSNRRLTARARAGRIALYQSIIDNRMPEELKDALKLLPPRENQGK